MRVSDSLVLLQGIFVVTNNHVVSNDYDQLRHLQQLLSTLSIARLYTHADPGILGRNEVEYLHYTISLKSIRLLSRKFQAVKDFPRPKAAAEFRPFLEMYNFYHCCISSTAANGFKSEKVSQGTILPG